MAVLRFTLSPDAVCKIYDSLACLGKFSESVSIEATRDRLVLTALNSTNSAYACFTFIATKFFTKYLFNPPRIRGGQQKEKFTCKIYNKALISVFKGRTVDPFKEKDTSIEKCEVIVEDGPDEVKSRFIIKMICMNGEQSVIKTYRLTFESAVSMHALFNQELAKNRWSVSSRTLREFIEHFGPKTEQLDIYSEDGRVFFTSYTEKVVSGNEILKQPLFTTIAVDAQEFREFSVEEKLHIVISVKDFKAIATHSGITNIVVSAFYSQPSKPMQLKYSDEGMVSEFILMTIGETRGTSAAPAPATVRGASNTKSNRQALEASSNRNKANGTGSMPPPPRSVAPSIAREIAKVRGSRTSSPPPQANHDYNPLFLPSETDDDRRWDPADEEDEEMLGWDASTDNNTPVMTLSRVEANEQRGQGINGTTRPTDDSTQRLAPTQRMSQIRGLFDD